MSVDMSFVLVKSHARESDHIVMDRLNVGDIFFPLRHSSRERRRSDEYFVVLAGREHMTSAPLREMPLSGCFPLAIRSSQNTTSNPDTARESRTDLDLRPFGAFKGFRSAVEGPGSVGSLEMKSRTAAI